MVSFLEKPEQFKAELKDKWLDYYQENRNWLQALMTRSGNWKQKIHSYEDEELEQLEYNDYSPRRPNDCFIFGVISSLEPQLSRLFNFIAPNDSLELIKQLGLDFDPEIELKKRSRQQSQQQEKSPSEYLDKIREEIKT